jgi:hypothetical protein
MVIAAPLFFSGCQLVLIAKFADFQEKPIF